MPRTEMQSLAFARDGARLLTVRTFLKPKFWLWALVGWWCAPAIAFLFFGDGLPW